MDDMISRQAAIDALVAETIYTEEELREYYRANSHRNEWVNGIYEAVEAIKQLPSAQPDVPDINVGDMISRAKAIEALVAETIYTEEELREYYEANSHRNEWVNGIYEAVEVIKQLPPAQPERIKGHWIKISPANIYECSECGKSVMTNDICAYDFCHGCGADMREVTT